MTDWIGLPRSAKLAENAGREQVNASPEMNFPKWPDWPADLKQQLLDYCGELMERYGYRLDLEMKVSPGLAGAAAGGDNRVR